jgi:flavorubredoxin
MLSWYIFRVVGTLAKSPGIAKELEITPIDVKKEPPDVSNVDMLIVGSGTYGGKPGKPMVAYLENLENVTGKRAACFSSCAGDASKTLVAMKEILNKKGYTIVDCFSCFGKFAGLAKRGHPTNEELNQGKEFAKKLNTSK